MTVTAIFMLEMTVSGGISDGLALDASAFRGAKDSLHNRSGESTLRPLAGLSRLRLLVGTYSVRLDPSAE
jgi:hypothetical protein